MVLQDHVRGHQLGDAGDGHLPGRARAVRHADAADVSGRDPSPGHETAPSCSWLGVAVPARGVTLPEGEVACAEEAAGRRMMSSAALWCSQPGMRVRPAAPGFP